MKVGAIIQARVSSTRLPGKVLMDLLGKTVLERVVERVKAAKLVKDVVVATTLNKEDDGIESLCEKVPVKYFRGSENDVLDRFYQAAKYYQIENIVRITADCPLMDPRIIDKVTKLHLEGQADYTANIIEETYPDGEDVEVFTFAALTKAWENASLQSEREHVTSYIRNNAGLFKIVNLRHESDLSDYRWTLDEKTDYEFIKFIYSSLYKGNNDFGLNEVVEFLKSHPEASKINQNIGRNEGYLKSLRNDRKVN